MKNRSSAEKWIRRACALLLAVLSLFCVAVVEPQASAESLSSNKGTVEMLKWKRCRSRSDLPTTSGWFYAMIAYVTGDGTGYCVDIATKSSYEEYIGWFFGDRTENRDAFRCRACSSNTWFSFAGLYSDSTTYDEQMTPGPSALGGANAIVQLKYNGEDRNCNSKTYKVNIPIKHDNGSIYPEQLIEESDEFGFRTASSHGDAWTFKQRGSDFHIYYNEDNGYDTHWRWHGDKIWGIDTYKDDEADDFRVWTATLVKFSAIVSNYTVRSGRVLNIDDEVVLMDNVTLTVEPGAVLSIEGRFYDNGKIDNYGTVVVQPGGTMMPFCASGTSPSSVYCYGGGWTKKPIEGKEQVPCKGDLIVMKGGRLVIGHGVNSGGTLALYYGAALVNDGGIVVSNYGPYIYNDSRIENRKGGYMFFGVSVNKWSENSFYRTSMSGSLSKSILSDYGLSQYSTYGSISTAASIVNSGYIYSYVWDMNPGFTTRVTLKDQGQVHTYCDVDASGGSAVITRDNAWKANAKYEYQYGSYSYTQYYANKGNW